MAIKKRIKELGSSAKLVSKIPVEVIKRVFTNRNQTSAFPDLKKKK